MPQNKIPNRLEFQTLDTQMIHLSQTLSVPDSPEMLLPIHHRPDLMSLTQAILPVSTPSPGHNIDQKCRGIL